ncbi:hypothetical protein [Pseudomonas putida]|uniref:hypothetical protein n=1 Tax=Pseudomonas putida TaxID=303 RepID=UPI00156298F7|nr:hypothetical protein [Pseudomonas putida]
MLRKLPVVDDRFRPRAVFRGLLLSANNGPQWPAFKPWRLFSNGHKLTVEVIKNGAEGK